MCFNRMKHIVSLYETLCFNKANTLLQAFEQSVYRLKTSGLSVCFLVNIGYMLYSLPVIGDRGGDRLISNLSPLESTMNKGIQKTGDRLIEKMMFFFW